MRRLATSFLALLLTATAALPGAAVFATPAAVVTCTAPDFGNWELVLADFPVVVIATVEDQPGPLEVRLTPEAYLKGPAQNETIDLVRSGDNEPDCGWAEFEPGQRVLLMLDSTAEGQWPSRAGVFVLTGGAARYQGPATIDFTESGLVDAIRGVTEQYAVPAAGGEGAAIDWWRTVLPVGAATLFLFGVGLYLMRIWHRIDPT